MIKGKLNSEKENWIYKISGKTGHYMPFVIVSEDGDVVGGGINREKTELRADRMSTDSLAYFVHCAKTGRRLA